MIKELFEDIHRMKGDYNMNNRKSNVYSLATGNIKQTKTWRNIKMGEILEIKKDEEIPADLMLLYAEDNEGNALDMVFIDTLNLDGENYLKQRDVIDSSITSKQALHSYSGYV